MHSLYQYISIPNTVSFSLSLFSCLVEGKEILKKLEATETYNGRPNRRCQISNCGRLGPLSD